MGLRYVLYRIKLILQKKTGFLRKKFPVNPTQKFFITLNQWRQMEKKFYWNKRPSNLKSSTSKELAKDKQRILQGTYTFFSGKEFHLGKKYDWITNPDSGYTYDISMHWSDIPDISEEAGDIKYVWEKSRFGYLQTIIRNDYHHNEDHSEWIFSEMDSWIASNPVNSGPNYICSQEISLRLINWSFALNFYSESKALNEDRWRNYQHFIYWQLHHVYHHISFSRIAVRNNHAITETGILAISNILFPFIPETVKWSSKGRKWLEQEVDYQVYEDGTFLQFSMNYHRVLVQLFTAFIALAEVNGQPFSRLLKEKAWRSIKFLYRCQEYESGRLPNYGANDGALFFKWTSCNYRDFRPQLNALHLLLTRQPLYNPGGEWDEEVLWWGLNDITIEETFEPLKPKAGISVFEKGGYFVIRDADTITFMRCGSHKDRPSQADNLHVDIWKGKENVLRDAGSYLYNTKNETMNYFMGTASHNTVVLNNYDQMLKGGRFIWYYWTQAVDFSYEEGEDHYMISGTIKVFQHVSKNIKHSRRVIKLKNSNFWKIEDRLIGVPSGMDAYQLWHGSVPVLDNIQAFEEKEIGPIEGKDWYSSLYGIKEEGHMISIPFKKSIVTQLEIL
ncbi:alginate lyase family protein [Fulvivirga kasyanovii]|uniref:Alginate lyase family protein n=2 Tax=Fulvivirga kasyanovii TaxID=396812 RepID=A0ABW9RKZ8_9BACT|nr:alginate lyase family protein [Fulvivirga kasyanovii]